MTLALVDLGCGNLGSVAVALERFGVTPMITADPDVIEDADKVLLPGVGAAGYAMAQIESLGLVPVLRRLTQPVLGICLGMQLLFDRSDEDDTVGLGLIPGEVRRLTPALGRPVPHMGWSKLQVMCEDLGVSDGDYVYFAHSFAADVGPWVVASADDGQPIPAIIRQRNFTGAQFHPERSGAPGARFLDAWLNA